MKIHHFKIWRFEDFEHFHLNLGMYKMIDHRNLEIFKFRNPEL